MTIPGPLQDWVSIFLGIIVEASPFLLLGVVLSSAVEVFVSEDRLLRLVPRNPVLSLAPALGLGLLMPVCECGNIAVARRFLAKGVPLSSCIAFLLAAPILNPVSLFATWTAFHILLPDVVWLRAGLAIVVASIVGLVIGSAGRGEQLLAASIGPQHHHHHHEHDRTPVWDRLLHAASHSGDEFLAMIRVLLIGASLAAATQVLIPRSAVAGFGTGIVFAVLAMMSLAFVLSICSTVDAFFALSYTALFPTPAIVAFLVFGPMLGMKTTGLMFTAFRPRVVLAIAALTAEIVLLAGLVLN